MIEKILNQIYRFLRKAQKYTKTDNVYLFKGGSFLFVGHVISAVANFFLIMALAKFLPKEIYGQYKYILSLLGLLGLPVLVGIEVAVIQAVARGFEGSFWAGFKTKLRWGILGSLCALRLASYYWIQGNSIYFYALLMVAFALPFLEAFFLYMAFLEGKKLFNIRTKYKSIQVIGTTVALITVAWLTNSLLILIAAYLVSHVIFRFLFFILIKRRYISNQKEDPKTISYGKHLSLIKFSTRLFESLDSILLFHYVGAIELAIYHLAIYPVTQITNAFKDIRVLAFPKFATRTKEEIKKTLLKKLAKLLLPLLAIFVLYILFVPYVYKIFFPQYIDSIFYSQLYALTIIFFPVTIFSLVFTAQQMTKQLYWFQTTSSVIGILFLIILVPFYGILGVILARIFYRFYQLILGLIFFKRM